MKIKNAIEIIQKYEPEIGYHVAFSGGKDSVVVYDLVKRAKVKHQAYFCLTTVDPIEVLKFIKKQYPEVIWLRPKKSMSQLIVERGLPIRTSRFCCQELKEYAGDNQTVITGIRWDESNSRKNRKFYEKDTRKNKWYVNPIIDWEEFEIWDYTEKNNLSVCPLYETQSRIGCIGCPMIYYKKRQRELNRYPHIKRMYLRAIRKRMDKGFFNKFKDEYDVYEWWVGNIGMDEYLRQRKIEFGHYDTP
jgi:phosphoadenosine phosphosulfate reductase